MQLIYFGDGPWARQAFKQLLETSKFEVSLVVLRYNSSDHQLENMAREKGIEICTPEDVNACSFMEKVESTSADIGVSMSYNQIFKKNLIRFFPKGIINCHAGKLPRYRGRNVLNWALINGEEEIGVTCHYVDQGIDTGDIILQKTFSITDDDDYGTVLQKAYELCPEILLEALEDIYNENVDVRKQSEAGTYYVKRKEGDEFIDWSWSSRQIFNFVRGITTPGPCAQTWFYFNGSFTKVLIRKVRLVEEYPSYNCISGAVIAKSLEGNLLVKTGDTVIELLDYEIESNEKSKLKVGDRLGFNVNMWLLKKLEGVPNDGKF